MKFLSIFNIANAMAAKITLCGLLFLSAVNLYAAEPTLSEVYQAAQAGRLQEAETMMTQVLNAHPDSAKAHFVKAEILAKEGRIPEARGEFSQAERLQPNMLFAKPVAVDMLKRKLGLISSQPVNANPPQESGTGSTTFIWGILIVGAIIVWLFIRSRSRSAYSNVNNTYGANPAAPNGGYGPGYYPPQGGGMGSGIVGGLATGAAVGAGIVAGEVLMHRMLDDNHPNNGNYIPDANQHPSDNSFDMGGNDFGVTDNSSWDDSSSDNNDSSDWT